MRWTLAPLVVALLAACTGSPGPRAQAATATSNSKSASARTRKARGRNAAETMLNDCQRLWGWKPLNQHAGINEALR